MGSKRITTVDRANRTGIMWRFWLLLLLCIATVRVAFGGELPPPTPRKDRPVADELYFRRIQKEHNNLTVTTTNPNGAIRGILGDVLVYNNTLGGTYKSCVNVSSGEGTTWVCDANALTAP